MTSRLKDCLDRQFSMPTKGFMGWIATHMFKTNNSMIERNAARLCDIQPHHNVLEVGFGPGIGLQHALEYMKDGTGKLYGVDLSPYMLETAAARLSTPIANRKVELTVGTVLDLPYSSDTFDRVFHCNCYYFWPSVQHALQEIGRVMKPGAVMVTTLNLDAIKASQAKGFLKYGNPDPINYMCALEQTGFKDVEMEYFIDGAVTYQAIFAYWPGEDAV